MSPQPDSLAAQQRHEPNQLTPTCLYAGQRSLCRVNACLSLVQLSTRRGYLAWPVATIEPEDRVLLTANRAQGGYTSPQRPLWSAPPTLLYVDAYNPRAPSHRLRHQYHYKPITSTVPTPLYQPRRNPFQWHTLQGTIPILLCRQEAVLVGGGPAQTKNMASTAARWHGSSQARHLLANHLLRQHGSVWTACVLHTAASPACHAGPIAKVTSTHRTRHGLCAPVLISYRVRLPTAWRQRHLAA